MSNTYNANVEAIANYLKAGESCESTRKLGLEIEHFVVDSNLNSIFYDKDTNAKQILGVEDILEALSPLYEDQHFAIDQDDRKRLIGIDRPNAPVSIEPGAQLEISIGPFCGVGDLKNAYLKFRDEIDKALKKYGYELLTKGYRLKECARDIPLIPKHRYKMMDSYFKSTGKCGICMMRGSASTQVSIDFTDEEDCMAKMRIATLLGPLIYFLCDNSPVFENAKVGVENFSVSGINVPKRMVRAAIWDDVDPYRSGPAPFLFEPNPSYLTYAKMIMDRPPILTLTKAGDDSTAVYHGNNSAAEIYEGHLLDDREIEHLLSMFFFDARLKRYIEIRMADSMPLDYALAFTAFIKGLFYDPKNFTKLLEIFDQDINLQDIQNAKHALIDSGYKAKVYGRDADEFLEELIEMAREGLRPSDNYAASTSDHKTEINSTSDSMNIGDRDISGLDISDEALNSIDTDTDASASSTSMQTQDKKCLQDCPKVDEQAYIEPLARLVKDKSTLLESR